jgi:glycosyltransferase involved in cell wall biosynthesis
MSRPTLAVVTPTFDRPEGVARLLRSLREQSQIIEWTLVLVDDCSSRMLPDEVIRDVHVIVHRNARNSGPLVSRNRALDIAAARGVDLVSFVDDDDYVAPRFFEYLVRMWTDHRQVGWFVSRCEFVGAVPHPMIQWPSEEGLFDYFEDMQLDRKFVSDVMHVMTLERIGQTRFATRGRVRREWTFLSRVARGGPFYASNDVTKIAEYRDGGLTATTQGRAPDLVTCFDFVLKAAAIAFARPRSVLAWRRLARQVFLLPARLILLFASTVRQSVALRENP